MECYLGIDAGGSGSRWMLLAEDGVGRASGDEGPPIQVAECGVTAAADRVAELLKAVAAREGLPAASSVVVGLAGVGPAGSRGALETRLESTGHRVSVVGDTITGAAAALADGPGVAVFAGTGSFGVARDAAGALHRVGGRGSIASDHGSGYRVVRAAAEAALLAVDGMGPRTALEAVLPPALGVDAVHSLGVALKRRSTEEIARCFVDVARVAGDGDEVALAILADAAAGQVRLARAAAERARLDTADCTVTVGGGTARSEFYFAQVERALCGAGFGGELRGLPVPPAHGAALLARARARDEAPLARWIDG